MEKLDFKMTERYRLAKERLNKAGKEFMDALNEFNQALCIKDKEGK